MLSDVERKDAHPVECLALLDYCVSHGKPLHPEMGASFLTIKFSYHGIQHLVRDLKVSCWDIPFPLFHWPFFIVKPIFH
jgi:hypothetical protein